MYEADLIYDDVREYDKMDNLLEKRKGTLYEMLKQATEFVEKHPESKLTLLPDDKEMNDAILIEAETATFVIYPA